MKKEQGYAEYLLFLGQEYQHIKHSYDIWHRAKNLAKKISKLVNIFLTRNIFVYSNIIN